MENGKNKKNFKEIIEEYKFSALRRLDKVQLEQAYKELYSFYKDLGIENELLKNENEELRQKLEKTPKKVDYSNYNPNAKGIDKVIFILKQNSRLMLSTEIVRELLIVEPKLKQKWNNPYSAVIKYISRGVGFARIIQYMKIGSSGYTYGLPEWFDDGLLIQSYSYDQ